MPSFFIRGIAAYIAASAMERRERRKTSYTSPLDSSDYVKLSATDLNCWNTQMRWLIPFVQATGYKIVIENPKSHERIVIDQNTKVLPDLTIDWMLKYNKQELLEWMANEKEQLQQKEAIKEKELEIRRVEEARGRERFGNSFTLDNKNVQYKETKNQNDNKSKYVIPILFIVVFILALIGYCVYKSDFFAGERWKKNHQERVESVYTEALDSKDINFSIVTYSAKVNGLV